MGIFVVGMIFNNYLMLTQAVGAGGQYLQLIRTDPTATDPCSNTFAAITQAAPTLNSSNISLSFSLNGTPFTGNSCPNDQGYLQAGQPVTVTATYPCNFVIMGVNFAAANITANNPTGCQLQASVTEYEY
jgi:hypothetical protein